MNLLKNYGEFLTKGVYAGILIGIGGIAYLAISDKIVGTFIFSLGLLTVCMYDFGLFTGKIGYILVKKTKYLVELVLTLFGNFIGTFLTGNLIRFTKFSNYIETAQKLVNIKLADSPLSSFILSIFCGMLMYIAVNNYKNQKDVLGRYLGIIMGVMAFILCGFEHCVANMMYFSVANIWNLKVLIYLLIMIFGNSLGSVIIAFYYNKFCKH